MSETQCEASQYTFTYHLDDIKQAAEAICKHLVYKTVLVSGAMGAGKTTLIAAIAANMGCLDTVSSPTFSVVNEYLTNRGDTIYHFDLYRINSVGELQELGFESYLDRGSYLFIEWPENLFGYEPSETHRLVIQDAGAQQRSLTLF